MIRTCDNGHPPARVLSGTPCRECERRRPCRQARGYDAAHGKARGVLLSTLPAPCAYGCGTVLRSATEMVAAHVRDGDPSAGWVAACRSCNERMKRRGWGSASEGTPPASTRARQREARPGFGAFRAAGGDRRDVRPEAPQGAHVAR